MKSRMLAVFSAAVALTVVSAMAEPGLYQKSFSGSSYNTTGDPMSDYRGEPDTNDGWHGKRVNMGAWGNTPWATRTKFLHSALYIR